MLSGIIQHNDYKQKQLDIMQRTCALFFLGLTQVAVVSYLLPP